MPSFGRFHCARAVDRAEGACWCREVDPSNNARCRADFRSGELPRELEAEVTAEDRDDVRSLYRGGQFGRLRVLRRARHRERSARWDAAARLRL
jgi:hypothetical protein